MDSDQKKPLMVGLIVVLAVVAVWWFFFSGNNFASNLASGSTAQRLEAIGELERLNSSNAAEVISKYANDPDPRVAERVIISMGRMKDQVPTEKLLPLLDSPRAEVRVAAVIAIGSRGLEGNPVRLREQMLKDPDPSVRAAAINELKSMRDWDSVESFAKLLADQDVMVQNGAAEAIAHIGGIGHEGLRPTASSDQRQAAIRFLQQYWPSFKHNHQEYQHYLKVKGNKP